MIVGSLLTNKQLDIYIRHAVSCCRVFDLQIKEKYTTMSNIAIEFEHVSKQYRLGLVSTKTLITLICVCNDLDIDVPSFV